MLVRGLCFLLSLYLPKLSFCAESNYEEDVDGILKHELGDNPFQPRKYHAEEIKHIIHEQNVTIANNDTILNYSELQLSGEEIIENIVKTKLEMILNRDDTRVHDIINKIDGFQKITDTFQVLTKKMPTINGRRFSDTYNPLLEGMLYDAQETVEQILRFDPNHWLGYPYSADTLKYYYPKDAVVRLKKKAITAMYTHVYRAQYYMALAQKMRNRYIDHPRYKLGFSFCMLRILYKEQKTVLRAFMYSYNKVVNSQIGTLTSWALYTYGKIQRLERDIRDIMHHIKALEYERKMLEIPLYYEYFDSSTGRYSG